MDRFRNKYRIDSARLKGFDYSRDGIYFITICTKNRVPVFGEIVQCKMILSGPGKIVKNCWYDLPNHYYNIILDEFIIMPNHVHGLIIIRNSPNIKQRHGISEFIRAFKSFSSRRIHELFPVDVETGLRPVSTFTTLWIGEMVTTVCVQRVINPFCIPDQSFRFPVRDGDSTVPREKFLFSATMLFLWFGLIVEPKKIKKWKRNQFQHLQGFCCFQ